MQSLRGSLVWSHHLKHAPRYLKLVTVPSFCPFTFISLWMPLALFVISLVFSPLISILYLVQVLSRLSTRASSSRSSSARASMSSANRRLVIFLPPMLTFPSCSSRASEGVSHLGCAMSIFWMVCEGQGCLSVLGC